MFSKVRVTKWGGSCRLACDPLIKRGAGCLFQPAGLLRPAPYNPQPAHAKCGAGRVGPHNFKI